MVPENVSASEIYDTEAIEEHQQALSTISADVLNSLIQEVQPAEVRPAPNTAAVVEVCASHQHCSKFSVGSRRRTYWHLRNTNKHQGSPTGFEPRERAAPVCAKANFLVLHN